MDRAIEQKNYIFIRQKKFNLSGRVVIYRDVILMKAIQNAHID